MRYPRVPPTASTVTVTLCGSLRGIQHRGPLEDQPETSQAKKYAGVPEILPLHQNGNGTDRSGNLEESHGVREKFVNSVGVMAPVAQAFSIPADFFLLLLVSFPLSSILADHSLDALSLIVAPLVGGLNPEQNRLVGLVAGCQVTSSGKHRQKRRGQSYLLGP